MDFQVNTDRLRTFLNDLDAWMREGDVVKRKTLLRNAHQEIRLWPKTGTKPWTLKVFVAANLEALTPFFVVSPTGCACWCHNRWSLRFKGLQWRLSSLCSPKRR